MRLIKKIFYKFFLFNIFFITILCSKILLANNTNESSKPILQRLPTSIFATVNNEPISIYDLIQRANLFSISAKIPINEEFELRILPDLISGYVDEVIQMQEIRNFNITVSEAQVQAMVSEIEKENGFKKGKFKEYLKDNKTDISILEKQVRTNIGWRQLVANKFRPQVIIQDAEVETILKKLETSIGKEEFLIEQIFLSFENKRESEVLNKINNLYEEISSGGNFISIAKQFSDSYGGKFGKIGWVPEVDLDSNILNEVKKLEINETSKPLKGETGYFLMKILNKRKIGEETISLVSLFRFRIIENNEETKDLLKKINNCNELEDFSKKYATSDSGSLGEFNYSELSENLRKEISKMKKNEISKPIKFGNEEFQIMTCDIKKITPIIPSKFKITEILMNKKLDIIGRQFMSELRTKSIIDIRI